MSIKRIELTTHQQFVLTHALRIAAERYREHADDVELPTRIRKAFDQQLIDATDMQVLLDDATVVLVTEQA